MKKSLLAGTAGVLSIFGGHALAADMPFKAPRAISAFTWTSCCAGAHGAGGWARKDITDPIQLTQDLLSDAAGGGVEWALFENWSAKLEYEFYDFGTTSVLMTDNNLELSGPVRIKQTVRDVKLGLNFHMWSSDK
jgi:hypothetical protein